MNSCNTPQISYQHDSTDVSRNNKQSKMKPLCFNFLIQGENLSHFSFSHSFILTTSALFAPEHFKCNHTWEGSAGIVSADAEYPDDHTHATPCPTDLMVLGIGS